MNICLLFRHFLEVLERKTFKKFFNGSQNSGYFGGWIMSGTEHEGSFMGTGSLL